MAMAADRSAFEIKPDDHSIFWKDLQLSCPELECIHYPECTAYYRPDLCGPNYRNVVIISGGCGGYAPCHAGYIGTAMLSASICGDTFKVPSHDAILSVVRKVAGAEGCLVVAENFVEDKTEFELAATTALGEGITIRVVYVGDEVTLPTSLGGRTSAGITLIHKVAGAAASGGLSIEQVEREVKRAVRALRTVNSNVLNYLSASKTSEADSVERFKPSDGDIEHILKKILPMDDNSDDDLVFMVNCFSGLSAPEMATLARQAVRVLNLTFNLNVQKQFVGFYRTSLVMTGFSFSVMCATPHLLHCLNVATDALCWPGGAKGMRQLKEESVTDTSQDSQKINLSDVKTSADTAHRRRNRKKHSQAMFKRLELARLAEEERLARAARNRANKLHRRTVNAARAMWNADAHQGWLEGFHVDPFPLSKYQRKNAARRARAAAEAEILMKQANEIQDDFFLQAWVPDLLLLL